MNLFPWRAVLLTALITGLAGFLGGQYVEGLSAKVALMAEQKRASDAEATARAAAEKKAAADRKASEAIAAAAAAEERARRIQFTNVRKENDRVQKTVLAAGVPAHAMPAGWVRQYDAALSAGSGGEAKAAGGAADAAGGADASPSDVTEWDVLNVHTENAEKWASCRANLTKLLQFIEQTN